MRRSIVLLMVILCLGASTAKAGLVFVAFDDGGINNVSSSGPDEYVYIVEDSLGPPTAPTTLNLLSGATADTVAVLDNSTVNTYDGSFVVELDSYDNSNVNIYGGEVLELQPHESSNFNVYGGELSALFAYDNSIVNFYGTDFNYDYGSILDESGPLEGLLSSGQSISLWFEIDGRASINLIDPKSASCPSPRRCFAWYTRLGRGRGEIAQVCIILQTSI
jgi:hypothetical protein